MFRIFTTDEFDRDYDKLDNSDKDRVKKIFNQLRNQGDNVGKGLRISILREKKFDGKRIYFLVYNNYSVVLSLAISGKKAQQATINRILLNIDHYQNYVVEELKKRGLA
ncbi:hypothetical protein CMI42_03165 [Candidatus Pacearchaeota archaeon]|nr:hypothetical protein [Candidatus Pacearchaeota archaeon]|tara:strand:- start:273 stop:599 length:327 start_codon:yes stop_codon:yes gene_type:complete